MARGAQSKAKLIEKLKEIYPDSIEYGKEFRIPFEEDGQRVEIKVALTCAKSNVGGEGASEVSGVESNTPIDVAPTAPTEEEKANIAALMDRLGL